MFDWAGEQLAKPAVYTTFPYCQRLQYICTAFGGESGLEALHLALREALPHMRQLRAVEVDVEEQCNSAW
jgi:hypothetical protein